MIILLSNIEKVRIEHNDKLKTINPKTDFPNHLHIKKIYVNNKWYTDFKIYLNTEFEYVVKFWSVDEIKINLQKNTKWLYKGILAIYNNQTDDEQISRVTNHTNNIGFNKFDADFLSGMAKLILDNRYLTVKQLETSRNKMIKYANQLLKIAILNL